MFGFSGNLTWYLSKWSYVLNSYNVIFPPINIDNHLLDLVLFPKLTIIEKCWEYELII